MSDTAPDAVTYAPPPAVDDEGNVVVVDEAAPSVDGVAVQHGPVVDETVAAPQPVFAPPAGVEDASGTVQLEGEAPTLIGNADGTAVAVHAETTAAVRSTVPPGVTMAGMTMVETVPDAAPVVPPVVEGVAQTPTSTPVTPSKPSLLQIALSHLSSAVEALNRLGNDS
jgi:hypothetical protein